jgi:hypothetical protein
MVDICVGCELDLEELAWAAGLFDGEGTTIAKQDARRPDDVQPQMTVPQCGRDGVPEVLIRFQRAVFGLGVIDGPHGDSMYRWRARGFVDGQAALALLWPFLGGVKRAQATSALRAVIAQYRTGHLKGKQRRPRASMDHAPHSAHPTANRRPTLPEIERAWAAGFFDGEGWTGLVRAGVRIKGPTWHRLRASINQNGDDGVPPAVLARFQRSVDGAGRIEPHGEPGAFKWIVEDLPGVERVLGFLGPWLGAVKIAQARSGIDTFNAQLRLKGDAQRCMRGHEYERTYMSATGPKRRCNGCARIISRMKRASHGIKPRQFRNIARRYTF